MRVSIIKEAIEDLARRVSSVDTLDELDEYTRELVIIDEVQPDKSFVVKIIDYLRSYAKKVPDTSSYSDIQEVTVLKERLAAVMSRLSEIKSKLSEISEKQKTSSEDLELLERQLAESERLFNKFEEERMAKLDSLKKKIEELAQQKKELSYREVVDVEAVQQIEEQIRELSREYSDLQSAMNPHDYDKSAVYERMNFLKSTIGEMRELQKSYEDEYERLMSEANYLREQVAKSTNVVSEPSKSLDDLQDELSNYIIEYMPKIPEVTGNVNRNLVQRIAVAYTISLYFKEHFGVQWPWVLGYVDITPSLDYIQMLGLSVYVED